MVCAMFTACHTRNGNYVIYKVDDLNDSDDTIKTVLKSHLLGAKFIVTFTDNYISLKNADKMELYMPRDSSSLDVERYSQKAKSHGGDYEMSLIINDDGTLIYKVKLQAPHKSLFIPIQLGGPIDTTGVVSCWMSKQE